MTEKISRTEVLARYEGLDAIWPESDKWHAYTGKVIHDNVKQWVEACKGRNGKILNVGSGGENYGIIDFRLMHTDLCIKNLPRGDSVVCNAESLPFHNNEFDITICVGSVLNYCDALIAINELRRVTKSSGVLIIEFEKSENLEFFRDEAFCSNAGMVTTFYAGSKERIWVYSERYIESLLNAAGFYVKNKMPIHVISSSLLPFFSSNLAAKFSFLDKLSSRLPFLGRFSSNIMFLCETTP